MLLDYQKAPCLGKLSLLFVAGLGTRARKLAFPEGSTIRQTTGEDTHFATPFAGDLIAGRKDELIAYPFADTLGNNSGVEGLE